MSHESRSTLYPDDDELMSSMYPGNVLLLQGVPAEYKSSLLGIEDADNVDADAWFSFISLMQTKTTHIRSQRIIGTVAALLERKNHSVENPYPAAIIGGLNRKEAKPGAVLTGIYHGVPFISGCQILS